MDRKLAWPLVLSLAAHGLALLQAPAPPSLLGNPGLKAKLRQGPEALAEKPADPAPPVPEKAVAAPLAESLPEPPERTYEKKPAAVAEPAPPVAETADAAADEAPPQGQRVGIDSASLRQYHTALALTAARLKRQNPGGSYPRQAKEAGWGGKVAVRLQVSEAGIPLNLLVIGSSGHGVLDQAALEILAVAASHTPVPQALVGRPFGIDLEFTFDPREPE